MRTLVRLVLGLLGVVLLCVALYLVTWAPNASVATVDLGKRITLTVQCSSAWAQWTKSAQPASLDLDSSRLFTVGAAEGACRSGTHKIEEIAGGLAAGAVVALGITAFARRRKVLSTR